METTDARIRALDDSRPFAMVVEDLRALVRSEAGRIAYVNDELDLLLSKFGELEADLIASHQQREADEQLIGRMKEALQGWLTENAPGGWIDDLRQQLVAAKRDVEFHHDCRPNRLQAEAWRDDAKATNDRWADEVARNRALEADLTAVRQAHQEWQPIETAPKDGTRLLLHPGPRDYSVVGRRSLLNHWWESLPGKHRVRPSHWMPLPTEPEVAGVGRLGPSEAQHETKS